MRESFESLLSPAVSNAENSKGWDFSFLDERRRTDDVPWSYEDIVLSAAESASSMFDMDTGGGERLLALAKNANRWPARVVATESFEANVVVARRRLSSAGIEVIPCTSPDGLPFGDDEFPLIVNRHGRDVFFDIGAVVWYLLKVPWQIPHFTVEEYAERLRALHETIQSRGPIDVGSHHF